MALKIQDVLNMIEDAVKLKGAAVGLARKWVAQEVLAL